MLRRFGILATVLFASMSLVAIGCGPEETEEQSNQVDNDTNDDTNDGEGPDLVEPAEDSEEVLDAISDYDNWDYFADNDDHMESGHPGDTWVISYGNTEAGDAYSDDVVPYPQDSIIVKEEYSEDGADDPDAVTVMAKQSDDDEDWYWLKATPDLENIIEHPEAGPLEGSGDDAPPGCVSCHGDSPDMVVQHPAD